MSALATVARKSANGKFTTKMILRSGINADADIGSLFKSLHTLFDKYLDQMMVKFEQKMVNNF